MAKPVPYEFVFDYLPVNVVVKPMFGMHAVYYGNKIMLILCKREKRAELNGIWIATSKEYHESLKNDIPLLTSIVSNNDETRIPKWQMIKAGDEDFEASAIKLCEYISNWDFRIGNIPK